jgi:hypothetical protein
MPLPEEPEVEPAAPLLPPAELESLLPVVEPLLPELLEGLVVLESLLPGLLEGLVVLEPLLLGVELLPEEPLLPVAAGLLELLPLAPVLPLLLPEVCAYDTLATARKAEATAALRIFIVMYRSSID